MHEEADTGIFVNARLAIDEGSTVIVVKASDTNVLVIAVGVLPSLPKIGLQHLWIAFGQGRNLRWIPVHDLYLFIATQKSKGLLFSMPSPAAMLFQPFAERKEDCLANLGRM